MMRVPSRSLQEERPTLHTLKIKMGAMFAIVVEIMQCKINLGQENILNIADR